MSNFFALSDGTVPEAEKEFDGGGGFLDPIPDDTDVLAQIEKIEWAETKETDYSEAGEEYVSIQWLVLRPSEYQNRKIFHKIRVNNPDPKKADKAKRMLLAIDANFGGKLLALGRKPTDAELARALVNKALSLKMGVVESKEEGKAGIQYVKAVSPRKNGNNEASEEATPAPVTEKKAPAKKAAKAAPAPTSQFDDDIPF